MKVTTDASKELLQTSTGEPITFEVMPRYPVGYRFRHYATRDLCTVIGYSLTIRLWRDEADRNCELRELRYITRHEYSGQPVTDRETAESSIARCKELPA